ncbi:hypothetical protein [Haladaptatus halobius]|jgi:hypothetical protein|uniref:hypothetical protein n=1 Tax=Haladaptatus halobius TaxID=2884875 RepID=UPI001D0AE3B8|nr:hypothetical protein [Haladaptatus halobius]
MALIELNLEKPALKRTELVKEDEAAIEGTESKTEEIETEIESEGTEEAESTKGGSRTRTFARRAAVLGGTAAGIAAARKFRQRRQSKQAEQQELEEDWQAAE